jgi:hypothetical protein
MSADAPSVNNEGDACRAVDLPDRESSPEGNPAAQRAAVLIHQPGLPASIPFLESLQTANRLHLLPRLSSHPTSHLL